jgi:serine/threonine protein kinase
MNSDSRPLLSPGDTFDAFTIVCLLGQGGYGDIYAVKTPDHPGLCALKMESFSARNHGLAQELTLLNRLQGSPYFPVLYASGRLNSHHWMCIDLLGPSLSSARRQSPELRFSLETTLRISLFMLRALRELHLHGFVHGDVKPGNFLLKATGPTPVVLIDFGLSKRYLEPATGEPILERPRCAFRGTAKYASLCVHRGQDQCPRDDLISWLYSVVELVEGRLPWSCESDNYTIQRRKAAISDRTLLRGLPGEFLEIARYLNGLKYGSIVNYSYVLGLVTRAVRRECQNLDGPFDWELLPEAKVREMTPLAELPAGIDYAMKIPVVRQEPVGSFVENDSCTVCEVA